MFMVLHGKNDKKKHNKNILETNVMHQCGLKCTNIKLFVNNLHRFLADSSFFSNFLHSSRSCRLLLSFFVAFRFWFYKNRLLSVAEVASPLRGSGTFAFFGNFYISGHTRLQQPSTTLNNHVIKMLK